MPGAAVLMSTAVVPMARHAVVDLCAVFHLRPTPPIGDRLGAGTAERLDRFLESAKIQLRGDDASREKLDGLRALYEPYVQALANFLLMPLPGWMPAQAV